MRCYLKALYSSHLFRWASKPRFEFWQEVPGFGTEPHKWPKLYLNFRSTTLELKSWGIRCYRGRPIHGQSNNIIWYFLILTISLITADLLGPVTPHSDLCIVVVSSLRAALTISAEESHFWTQTKNNLHFFCSVPVGLKQGPVTIDLEIQEKWKWQCFPRKQWSCCYYSKD